jgi:hypothetical protein
VWGDTHDYYGVWGTSVAGDGVHGNSTTSSGVYGLSASGAGVWGESTGYDAVHGHTSNPNNNTSGVAGFGDGGNNGVFGVSGSGSGVFGSSGGAGVWGESTGYDAIHGHTSNPNGNTSGVAGFGDGSNNGTFGISGTGNGVEGLSSGAGASGVYGHNTTGYGVFGRSDSGYGMGTDGPAFQARNQGGWVKAMALIDDGGNGTILRCFNSQLPAAQASVPPCGFQLSIYPGATSSGPWVGGLPWTGSIDMGFKIDDRFIVVTPLQLPTSTPTTAQVSYMSGNVVQVSTWDSSGNGVEAQFFIVIY